MDIVAQLPGCFLLLLQLSSLVVAVCLARILGRAVGELATELGDMTASLSSLKGQTASTLWNPASVAVVASVFKINATEVEQEYRREPDQRQWIVSNVFPYNRLTKMMVNSEFQSRFVSVGYDYKAVQPASTTTKST